jgi:hypothetical protein
MATIESYIADIEARIAKNRQYIETTLDDAKRVGRSTLTKSADTEVERRFGLIDADKKALERARAIKSDEDSLESRLSETRSTGAYDNHERKTATVSVSRNERTYHQGKDIEAGFKNQPGGAFLLDIARSHLGDPMATDRLTRHMREEYVEKPWLQERSSDTTNFTGLVVPQYLTDQAAPAVSAMRPLADVMSPRSLPDTGMSVNLARITTPTAAGIQTSQNTTVTTQDIDDTLLTLNVQTAAGYSQLSRQAVERGILTEDVTTTDLLKRVAAALDVQLLGQASVGLAATATSQTYTNATVDTTAIPAFMKQLIQAQNAVETNMLAQASPSPLYYAPKAL